MFKKFTSYLLIFCFLLYSSGCASYRFGRLPSPYIMDHPNPVVKDGVSVVAKFLRPEQAKTTFDCEMFRRDMQPVFLVIKNDSDDPYHFRKSDVNSNYIPAEEASVKCARSTMGRVLGYGLLGVFVISAIVFIPMMIAEWINCPKINSRMKADYISAEIPDTTIAPGRSISGVIFVPPFHSGDKFTVPLMNRKTEERVLFRFRDASIPIKKKKEETTKDEEESEPKTNFSPKQNN